MKLNLQNQSVTIIGGGDFSDEDLDDCLTFGPTLISADGGANSVDANKYKPDYIIGDLDSLRDRNFWKASGSKLIKIEEQDTTDFEKCLYSVQAASYFCVGFIGRRADHFLSVCSSIVKYRSKKVILVGNHDIIFHVPRIFEICLPVNTRLSLYPLQEVCGIEDIGLKWSISGIKFNPLKLVGTSNVTIARKVKVSLSNYGMLMILPRSCLKNVKEALDRVNLVARDSLKT